MVVVTHKAAMDGVGTGLREKNEKKDRFLGACVEDTSVSEWFSLFANRSFACERGDVGRVGDRQASVGVCPTLIDVVEAQLVFALLLVVDFDSALNGLTTNDDVIVSRVLLSCSIDDDNALLLGFRPPVFKHIPKLLTLLMLLRVVRQAAMHSLFSGVSFTFCENFACNSGNTSSRASATTNHILYHAGVSILLQLLFAMLQQALKGVARVCAKESINKNNELS